MLRVGVKIDPVAFLVVKDGFTRIMPVAMPPLSTMDRMIEIILSCNISLIVFFFSISTYSFHIAGWSSGLACR